MFDFTFDDAYYFSPEYFPSENKWRLNDSYWRIYTHPETEPFCSGSFTVRNGELEADHSQRSSFDDQQIEEIKLLFKENWEQLNPESLKAHLIQPEHYIPVPFNSENFNKIFIKINSTGCQDPNFLLAFKNLTLENPAYRLTRGFIRRVLQEANSIPQELFDDHFKSFVEDKWIYDHEKKPGETFEDFHEKQLSLLYLPNDKHLSDRNEYTLFEINGLPEIYCLQHQLEQESLIEKGRIETIAKNKHYLDLGCVCLPIPLDNEYYIL